MNSPPIVLIDDASPGRERILEFTNPRQVIQTECPDEVPPALARIEAALAAGRHVAGYFAYELGYVLEPRLRRLLPAKRETPLLWFGVFDAPTRHDNTHPLDSRATGRAYAGQPNHEWSPVGYEARFARIHRYVADGDIYQANLSFRSRFTFVGDALSHYRDLRQRSCAPHGAFIDDGTRQILSLSPELFFELSSDGRITTRPMKGTAPRGSDAASDAAARETLRRSEKDRAENVMIVDLLRNDLGRVSQIGSVEVGELFTIETYPTLHTMVSTVRATLRPGVGVSDIVQAIFPCGSVTGAPKIRAMEIISEQEASPRGIYCGAIGHFAPDGSAQFNVAIRTLTILGARGQLGIGGAVVQDSSSRGEYDECILKARYFDIGRKSIGLIETMRWEPRRGFVRLDLHLARMAASAGVFGLAYDEATARVALARSIESQSETQRVRLTLDEASGFFCEATALGAAQTAWRFSVSPLQVSSRDQLLRHKTTWRELYDSEARRAANLEGADEVIFLNERAELTEGSRSNIFIRAAGRLCTPPLDAGVLDGVLRREMVDAGSCFETTMTLEDLARAEEVWLGNSLRGMMRATPTESGRLAMG